MRQRLLCYGIGILVGILMTWVYVWAQHGSWQDAYKSASGMPCCGRADCKAVPVVLVSSDGTTVEAMVLGIRVTVPARSVHPSETTQSYWCLRDAERLPANDNIWCLFYSIGG